MGRAASRGVTRAGDGAVTPEDHDPSAHDVGRAGVGPRRTGGPRRSVGGSRIVGVDAARGLAVLGMFTAHVGYAASAFWSPTGWLVVADGRSSATFALLAGVSIAIMAGGPEPVGGEARRALRGRLVRRAAVVGLLGYLLVGLGAPIHIILPAYAAMFLLAIPFLGRSSTTLLLAAAGFAVGGPLLLRAAGVTAPGGAVDLPGLLFTGHYPAVVWLAYVLTGLAVGRLPLRRTRTRLLLLGTGAGLALLGYGAGGIGSRAMPEVAWWWSTAPHQNTTPEVLGNLGVALAVLGLMLVVAETRVGRVVLTPVAATGAMALTVYTVQIVAIAVAGPVVVFGQTTNGTLLAATVVTLAACTLWTMLLGRGPLERLMRAVAGGSVRREASGATATDATATGATATGATAAGSTAPGAEAVAGGGTGPHVRDRTTDPGPATQ